MASENYKIIKNNGDKIINYKSNEEKAKKAWEKLQKKYKNVKIQYDLSYYSSPCEFFTSSHGTKWELVSSYDRFGNL
jgi:hypothetical protein